MLQNIARRGGFIIGGIVFLMAALVPLTGGKSLNVTIFIIEIAFLVIGVALAGITSAVQKLIWLRKTPSIDAADEPPLSP